MNTEPSRGFDAGGNSGATFPQILDPANAFGLFCNQFCPWSFWVVACRCLLEMRFFVLRPSCRQSEQDSRLIGYVVASQQGAGIPLAPIDL